jgi:thioredoxin-dependent peroxiredoxin
MRLSLLAAMMLSLLSGFGSAEASPLKVGDAVPAVTVNDQDGKPVDVAREGAKGLLLVYFYPKADTPGCTKQGCSIRDSWGELQKRGVTVLGVSSDDEKGQKAFREKYNLPFRLLADKEKKAITAFRVGSTFGFASRTAFLFEDGACVWIDPKSSTGDQADVVLKFLDARGK